MTLYQFNAVDEMEQAETVWASVHIGERRDEEHNIVLYQRDDFYVEVYHHKQLNVIRRIRAFKNTSQLEPYVGQIDITRLNVPG